MNDWMLFIASRKTDEAGGSEAQCEIMFNVLNNSEFKSDNLTFGNMNIVLRLEKVNQSQVLDLFQKQIKELKTYDFCFLF
ncbi:CLUMA_CG007488, isoform A [Clunio marinus]|uniref:CLUMA_CG007488, isoform A n=1 Tax=Clunio marinus TaxID=568069 RepID=A0A1J1I2H0_9DIPT|nr:CLUMA_CG007488, isoform A [Clunio marinus]